MGKFTLTKREARTAVTFLRRVVARGADEERELLDVIAKLERMADATYNEQQRTTF